MAKKDLSNIKIVDKVQLTKLIGHKVSRDRINSLWKQLREGKITDQDITEIINGRG